MTALDELVENKTIKCYKIKNIDENGNVGFESKMLNSTQLTIIFNDGKELILTTWCSGCLEDTGFFAKLNE